MLDEKKKNIKIVGKYLSTETLGFDQYIFTFLV